MGTNWPRVKISELCDLIVDCVNKTAPDVEYETPYKMIRTPNIKKGRVDLTGCRYVEKDTYEKWTRRAKVKKGDILLTREAPMGEVGLVTFEDTVFLGQRIMQYRVDPKKLDSNYLLYAFLSPDLQFQFGRYNNSGSIVSHIRVPDCFEFEINTPPLSLQKKIAGVLFSLDSKISLNNRINAELEAMAKTIYDYWFVQFDFPISAAQAASMGKPNLKGKPYKASGGKMVWSEELKREIPEGWRVTTIGEYAEVKKGDLITAKDAKDGEIKVVAAGVGYSYKHNEHNRLENTITVSGSGANAGFINFWREPIFASDCITVRGKDDTDTILLLHHLRFIQSHILSQATGSAQPHVYPSDIKILNYTIPSDSLIEDYGELVLPMNKKIAINLMENQKLIELRDWLLPMLMNGQIKIKDAERELAMAAEPEVEYKKPRKKIVSAK